MPDRPAERLPLEIIRLLARVYVASRGDETTNLYIHDAIYRAGEVLQPKRADIVIPRDAVLVFADDEPLKNWGHCCRYLLHDPVNGELFEEIYALLPPTLDFGAHFTAFHLPVAFPVTKSVFPVVALPAGIYVQPGSNWYAILYSGASMNRHVNDIEFLYRTLVNTYAIPPGNITVLSYDGTLDYNDAAWKRVTPPVGNWPGDGTPYQMKINGAGTKAELLNAIASVGKKLGANDNLLIHTNNHGNTVNGVSTIISYTGDDTTPSDLAGAIQALPKFSALMVMMEQCYSGGFLQPILSASPANCTSVATAVDANTESAGGADFDPFALDWISAMANANPDGSALRSGPGVDASAMAAFNYAKATDTGNDDDPQFGQNSSCGGSVRLGSPRLITFIPPLYRYLFPWQILPDPSPEGVGSLAVQVAAQLHSESFRAAIAASIEDGHQRLAEIIRGAL